jgi:hypothetical protein
VRTAASRLLFFLLLTFCGLNLAETVGRSAIPFSLQGKIRNLETRREVEPGVDDVHLLTVGDRVLQIDAELASRIQIGDWISKKGWETSLQTPRGRVRLALSQDFWGMGVVMPVLLGVGVVLLFSSSSASPTTKREPETTTPPLEPASSTAR